MNKIEAIKILEMVERGACYSDGPLAKMAFRYLKRLKINEELYNRIYSAERNKRKNIGSYYPN